MTNDRKDEAAVTSIEREVVLDEKCWVVCTKEWYRHHEVKEGEELIYNSKGTNNTNADTVLRVKYIIGPHKFACTGPDKLNG